MAEKRTKDGTGGRVDLLAFTGLTISLILTLATSFGVLPLRSPLTGILVMGIAVWAVTRASIGMRAFYHYRAEKGLSLEYWRLIAQLIFCLWAWSITLIWTGQIWDGWPTARNIGYITAIIFTCMILYDVGIGYLGVRWKRKEIAKMKMPTNNNK